MDFLKILRAYQKYGYTMRLGMEKEAEQKDNNTGADRKRKNVKE